MTVDSLEPFYDQLETCAANGEQVRLYVDLQSFDGFELGTIKQKLSHMKTLWHHVDRVAYVLDSRWMSHYIELVDLEKGLYPACAKVLFNGHTVGTFRLKFPEKWLSGAKKPVSGLAAALNQRIDLGCWYRKVGRAYTKVINKNCATTVAGFNVL